MIHLHLVNILDYAKLREKLGTPSDPRCQLLGGVLVKYLMELSSGDGKNG
jgi:hypothetical protein